MLTVLTVLHWLKVQESFEHTVISMTYKLFQFSSPHYSATLSPFSYLNSHNLHPW